MSIQYHECNQDGCDGYIAFESADFDYKESLNDGEYVLDKPHCCRCGREFRVVISHVLIEYDEVNQELIDELPETGWKQEYDKNKKLSLLDEFLNMHEN